MDALRWPNIRLVALAIVAAAMLAGCAATWDGTTFDRRAACQSHTGRFTSDGDCVYGGP